MHLGHLHLPHPHLHHHHQLRKEQHYESVRKQAQEETAAENDRSVQDERDAIQAGCTKLKVRIKEINPDGHW